MGRSPESIKERKEAATRLRAERKRLGLCTWCGVKAKKGRTLCSKHLARSLAIALKSQATEEAKERIRQYKRTRGRFSHISGLARRQGKEWGLTEEAWHVVISMPCFYCQLENNSGGGVGLDRLDNSKGYISGNVVSCCKECNTARMDNFSPEEMRVIGRAIREIKLARRR